MSMSPFLSETKNLTYGKFKSNDIRSKDTENNPVPKKERKGNACIPKTKLFF